MSPSAASEGPSDRALPVSDQLLELVLTTPTVEAYLDELALLADQVSPVIAGVGITLRRGHQVFTVATSAPIAAAVDEVQYSLGQGPCLSAMEGSEVVTIEDMATEERFGAYPAHALTHGVRSTFSVPLHVGGVTVGALNSYALQARAFEEAARTELVSFGAQAQIALALTLRAAAQSDVVDQLHTAMQTRSHIDQALGIVMTRQRCTAREAFEVLRTTSQSRNRKIIDIATDLITNTTGQPPEVGRFET